ncbi:MAG: hypothetical protein WCK27_25280 [Verrucomicrobiota bacterium]
MMQNITQVANWLCPDSTDHPSGPGPWPATITPQPLINSQSETQCNDSDVSPGNPEYCAEGHPRHEKPVCGEEFGAYSERDFWSRLLDPTTQVKVDLNLYQPLPGVEVSLARCQKAGFKGAQARVVWHGQPGFEYNNSNSQYRDCVDIGPQLTTKYRTASFSVSRVDTTSMEGVETSAGWARASGSVTVDRLSGVLTGTGNCTFDGENYTSIEQAFRSSDTAPGYDGGDLGVAVGIWSTVNAQALDVGKSDATGGGQCVYTDDSVSGCCSSDDAPLPSCPDGRNFDCRTSWVGPSGDRHWRLHDMEEWSHTNTTLHWKRTHEIWEDDTSIRRTEVLTADITLSDPFTLAEVNAMLVDMAGKWDLTDDVQQPWRTDPWVTVHPLVSYDSVPSPVRPCDANLDLFLGIPDPNAQFYSGALRGAPLVGVGAPMGSGKFPAALARGQETTSLSPPSYGVSSTQSLPDMWLIDAVVSVKRYGADGTLKYTGVQGTTATQCDASQPLRQPPNALPTYDFSFCQDDATITFTDNWGAYVNQLSFELEGPYDDYLLVEFSYYDFMGGHFDRKHVTYHYYQPTEGDGQDWYEDCKYYGSYSAFPNSALDPTDSVMPASATQWTDSITACHMPPGAWVGALTDGVDSVDPAGVIWLQKYAEIKLPWKSQNWFGPCGKLRDERSYSCEENEGENGCVSVPGEFLYPIVAPIEGDRLISSVKDATDTGESPAVPAGRVRVHLPPLTPALYLRSAGDGTVAGSNTSFGTTGSGDDNGDLVEFTDRPTDAVPSVLLARHEVLAVAADGSWFEIEATKAEVGAAVAVRSVLKVDDVYYSAPNYWWYDTDGKGEYSAITFDWDRTTDPTVPTYETTITHGCFQYDRCTPAVMCFSPNGEEFANGVTHAMGGFNNGTAFGFTWQGIFRQAMQDVYWQPPGNPDCQNTGDEEDVACGSCPQWEDDGRCFEDDCAGVYGVWSGHNFYAHAPLVEAREGRPDPWIDDDVNAMPVPTFPGYAPPAILGMFGCGPGGPGSLPSGDYKCGNAKASPNVLDDEWAPWITWLNMQACICANGRFAEDYKLVLGCKMCGSEPNPYGAPDMPPPPIVPPPWEGTPGMTGGDDPMTGH